MNVAILTAADARTPIAWSGTPYFMSRALERRFGGVEHLGPLRPPGEILRRVRHRAGLALLGRPFPYEHSVPLARAYGRRFAARILRDTDLIVAPAASTAIAFLETDVPILYTSDATFALMRDYYGIYTGLPEPYARGADEVERRALARATWILYPSEWAARSARESYGVPAAKIRVVPYGANLERVPSREAALGAKRDDELRLLFVGGDWERKGGPIVIETASRLREEGLPVRLTICGCVPPRGAGAAWIEVIPRLDKRRPADEARLSALLLGATFLFVPSRQECYGIVFCEASAHGTPSVARDTGGIAGAVRNGGNGLLLPADAGADAYARVIAETFRDRARYRQLVAGSRAAYEERLNWEAWARGVEDLVAAPPPIRS
ncbi:MAG: glycosyltransferase family 4 protein [Hyphomicrobiales bacterium]